MKNVDLPLGFERDLDMFELFSGSGKLARGIFKESWQSVSVKLRPRYQFINFHILDHEHHHYEHHPDFLCARNSEARVQDFILGHHHDIGSMAGLVRALDATLALREAAVLWLGIPCSTFVWMSSSRHKRTPTAPFGNPKYTKKANILVLRAMFLAIVATLRGVYVGIEQPSSSMLMYVPHLRMLAALAGMNWRHVKTHLACWRTL